MQKNTLRNVIYIHTHDMGRYISPYGHAVPTPHLQDFAKVSTLFRQAHCCGPTCSPSRAGLLTGTTPHEAGMLGLAHRGFSLADPSQHLASYLRSQGFETALCGVQHEFNCAPEEMPYDHIAATQEPPPSSDEEKSRAAVDYLRQTHERPFFLSFGLFYPHRKFKQADYSIFRPGNIRPPDPLPDTPEIRRDMADYHCTIANADANIGTVLEAIRQTGRDRDSLIILTTDHGPAFPMMKCNLTDHGTGVSLMIQYPGNPSSGDSVDALVSHLDIFPTICDLLGLDPPAHLRGLSLRPLFEKTASSLHKEIFSEVTFHASYEPMRSVRTDRYKLIRRFGFNRRRLANCDSSISKDVLLTDGWDKECLPSDELYDLFRDPHECCNLANEPGLSETLNDLSFRLEKWMRRTNDPLLHGDIPPPPGASINRADARSTSDLLEIIPYLRTE